MSDDVELLLQELKLARGQQPRVDILNRLAIALADSDLSQARQYGQQAVSLARGEGTSGQTYRLGLAAGLRALAQLHLREGTFAEALALLMESNQYYQAINDPRIQAEVLLDISQTCHHLGDLVLAQTYAERALEIGQAAHRPELEERLYIWLGTLLIDQESYPRAVTSLNEARRLAHNMVDLPAEAQIDALMCTLCARDAQDEKALEYGEKSIAAFHELHDPAGELDARVRLGEAYRLQDRLDEAAQQFAGAAAFAREASLSGGHTRALRLLGETRLQAGAAEEALVSLRQALQIGQGTVGDQELGQVQHGVYLTCRELSQHAEALQAFEAYHQITHAQDQQRSQALQNGLHAVYHSELARKDAEISQLRNVDLKIEVDKRRRAEDELLRITTTDELTGCHNRRAWVERAEKELARVRRYKTNLTIVLIEIDDFIDINANHGRMAGDQVLKHMANFLRANLREVDEIGRFSGTQFSLLLPETGVGKALMSADRLRAGIASTPVRVNSLPIHITASLGVAGMDSTDNLSVDDLLFGVDWALSQAREGGGDRATVWQSLGSVNGHLQIGE